MLHSARASARRTFSIACVTLAGCIHQVPPTPHATDPGNAADYQQAVAQINASKMSAAYKSAAKSRQWAVHTAAAGLQKYMASVDQVTAANRGSSTFYTTVAVALDIAAGLTAYNAAARTWAQATAAGISAVATGIKDKGVQPQISKGDSVLAAAEQLRKAVVLREEFNKMTDVTVTQAQAEEHYKAWSAAADDFVSKARDFLGVVRSSRFNIESPSDPVQEPSAPGVLPEPPI
ncbi:MAG: hypothetical protein HOQ12_06865 [Gemmatimonadaceae bacterium]|nr:hypothetical protein [Gemmatimonadaceae bacterium]